MKNNELVLDKKVVLEIFSYDYNGIMYELHVTSLIYDSNCQQPEKKERFLKEVFAEKGQVDEKMYKHFEEVIKNLKTN